MKHFVDDQARLCCSPQEALDLSKITFKLDEIDCRKCLRVVYKQKEKEVRILSRDLGVIRDRMV